MRWIQIERVGADEDISRVRRFEYRYAAGLQDSYCLIDQLHHFGERKVFEDVERCDDRTAFVGERLQELRNFALYHVETHLAAGADQIPVQVNAFGGYAGFP